MLLGSLVLPHTWAACTRRIPAQLLALQGRHSEMGPALRNAVEHGIETSGHFYFENQWKRQYLRRVQWVFLKYFNLIIQ